MAWPHLIQTRLFKQVPLPTPILTPCHTHTQSSLMEKYDKASLLYIIKSASYETLGHILYGFVYVIWSPQQLNPSSSEFSVSILATLEWKKERKKKNTSSLSVICWLKFGDGFLDDWAQTQFPFYLKEKIQEKINKTNSILYSEQASRSANRYM